MTTFIGQLGSAFSALGNLELGGAPGVTIIVAGEGELRHRPRLRPSNRDDYLGRTIRSGRNQYSEGGSER